MTDHEQQAYDLGVEHAKNAASWTVDRNTSQDHIRRVLAMLDDGDPQAFDYLPTQPNLSGEWADAPTPRSLALEIVGPEVETLHEGGEITSALCDAYEAGVLDTFASACEIELRNALDSEATS